MNRDELAGVVAQAKCRIFGWEDASNDAHRQVLSALIRTVQDQNATILCEPSLVRSTTRPPDIVLICPVSGVSVIEVKGFGVDQIDGIDPGGQFVVRYSNGAISRNPFAQVRNAMFDVKDAAARFLGRDPSFGYWYFATTRNVAEAVRECLPGLAGWVASNIRTIADRSESLDRLLAVTEFFLQRPWPDCYARQIPVAVDTTDLRVAKGLSFEGEFRGLEVGFANAAVAELSDERFAGGVAEFKQVVGGVVRQVDMLCAAPDGFDRIEIGSVGRQEFGLEPAGSRLAKQLRRGAMDVQAVHYDDELRLERASQSADKRQELRRPHVAVVELPVAADPLRLRRERHGADRGEPIVFRRRS